MKILFVGDIYGEPGRDILKKELKQLQQQHAIDFTIVNAENTTHGRGLSFKHYNELDRLGIDAMTMGNHTFGNSEIFDYIHKKPNILRPDNGHPDWPGSGVKYFESAGKKICVINLLGGVGVTSAINPFIKFDAIYADLAKDTDIVFVDFHAEMTSEKIAFGYHTAGRATVVVGTHTHVQTADERILENKTAYITDVGMTGPLEGVIGVKKEIIIQRFLKDYPARFQVARGKKQLNAVVVTIDDKTNLPTKIERIHLED